MGKETPNYEAMSEILQRRIDRQQADRQLRKIIETGGIVSFISDKIAKEIAPLLLRIATLEEELATANQRLDSHDARLRRFGGDVRANDNFFA